MIFKLMRGYDLLSLVDVYRLDAIGFGEHLKTSFRTRPDGGPPEINVFSSYLDGYHRYYNNHTGEGEEADEVLFSLLTKMSSVLGNFEMYKQKIHHKEFIYV